MAKWDWKRWDFSWCLTLASPAMGHWGTCPLDLRQLIFSLLHFGAIKVWTQCQMSSGLCVPQLLKLLYFHVTEKMKRVCRICCKHSVALFCIILRSLCDLSYFHIVLCPSSRQILATPLVCEDWWFVSRAMCVWRVIGRRCSKRKWPVRPVAGHE